MSVVIFKYAEHYSKDCQINLDRLEKDTQVEIYYSPKQLIDFSEYSVFIDAVFGIGLNRKIPGFVADNFRLINALQAKKIAIDVPSGLFLSTLTPDKSIVFKADHTLTFQCPKLNFFLPRFGNHIGKINVIDIGLDKTYIQHASSDYVYVDEQFIQGLFKKRERFSHKGTYGHALLVGGQEGMLGCMVLSSRSAMRFGAGKVSVVIPKCGLEILHTTLPEAMAIPSIHENYISKTDVPFLPSIIGIGMGIGQGREANEALSYYLKQSENPMLIDADGLNIISTDNKLLKAIPPQSILTPHQGELKRLIGEWTDDYDKIEKLKHFSTQHKVVLVSKDAFTFIVYGYELYINSTGNAGMATAGSGDVLSGLITGLVAQGYSTLNASILGVYIHGLSGDLYSSTYDENTLMASDLIENFKEAFSLLKK